MNVNSTLLRSRLMFIELRADELKKYLSQGSVTTEQAVYVLNVIAATARNAHADFVKQEGEGFNRRDIN